MRLAERRLEPPVAAWKPDLLAAVRIRDLARRLGERQVLAGVAFELRVGSTLVVVGPNGAGKTTLIRVIAGLLRPHGGRVEVLGRRLPDETADLRRAVGFLGHAPLLHGQLSARENLRYYARLYGVPVTRADELLREVGMAARGDEPVRTLSRGLLQRVDCARACLHRPALLLLDEPWANLDVGAAAELRALLDREAGSTRIVVTHDLGHAVESADVLLGLRAGECVLLSDAPRQTDLDGLFA